MDKDRLLTRLSRPMVERMIVRDLRGAFRRVCWSGDRPEFSPNQSIIVYANHHNYFDGHLIWYLVERHWNRSLVIWMEELERFPFFTAVGALPFPKDDSGKRFATIRRTARHLESENAAALVFPSGDLTRAEAGIGEINAKTFQGLDRIIDDKIWCPIAIHISWLGESLPTAILSAGSSFARSDGQEKVRLETAWNQLKQGDESSTEVILEGRRGPAENWDFGFLNRFYKP